MKQAVQSRLDLDESAVRHERAHGAGDGVAFFQCGTAVIERPTSLLFENHAAIDNDILIGNVELGNAAGNGLADESFEFGGVARAAAAAGHEGAHADVDAEAAFHQFGHGAGDGDFLGVCALQAGPVARLRHTEAREIVVALFVAAGDGDRERVAGMNRLSIILEGRARQNAFHLVADVEDHLIGGERNHRALELLGRGAMRVLAVEGGKRVGEGLGRLGSGSG